MAGQLALDQLVNILGSGEMASHHALDVRFEVRILAPQPKKYLSLKKLGYFDFKILSF
jgi:hypothetical protein